jgi:hypothetical protein
VRGWDLACCYIPATEPPKWRNGAYWKFVLDRVDESFRGRQALIIGDLNSGLHYRDELGATLPGHDSMAELERRGWRDCWTERNRKERPPGSWWSASGNPFRLDHALVSPASPKPRSISYPEQLNSVVLRGAGGLSNHSPVVVGLA